MGLGFPCPWIIGKIDTEGLGAELFQFRFGFIVLSFMFLTRIEKKEMRLYIVPMTIGYLPSIC